MWANQHHQNLDTLLVTLSKEVGSFTLGWPRCSKSRSSRGPLIKSRKLIKINQRYKECDKGTFQMCPQTSPWQPINPSPKLSESELSCCGHSQLKIYLDSIFWHLPFVCEVSSSRRRLHPLQKVTFPSPGFLAPPIGPVLVLMSVFKALPPNARLETRGAVLCGN